MMPSHASTAISCVPSGAGSPGDSGGSAGGGRGGSASGARTAGASQSTNYRSFICE